MAWAQSLSQQDASRCVLARNMGKTLAHSCLTHKLPYPTWFSIAVASGAQTAERGRRACKRLSDRKILQKILSKKKGCYFLS